MAALFGPTLVAVLPPKVRFRRLPDPERNIYGMRRRSVERERGRAQPHRRATAYNHCATGRRGSITSHSRSGTSGPAIVAGTHKSGFCHALGAEQRTFAAGNWETAMGFFSGPGSSSSGATACSGAGDNLVRDCGSTAANRSLRPRMTERHNVHVLGPNAAHTITRYATQLSRPRGTMASYRSVVTKAHGRQGNAWRIVHFHEAAAQPPSRLTPLPCPKKDRITVPLIPGVGDPMQRPGRDESTGE